MLCSKFNLLYEFLSWDVYILSISYSDVVMSCGNVHIVERVCSHVAMPHVIMQDSELRDVGMYAVVS